MLRLSNRLRQRRRTSTDMRGVTLIEVLVAVTILTVMVVGIGMATVTLNRAGESATSIARRSALLTAFGEAIKNLPYQDCASNVDYQNSFDAAEGALSDANEDLRQALGASLVVTATSDGSTCPGKDSGTQKISLSVDVFGKSSFGEIVKRTPETETVPVVVDFEHVVRSGANDPQVVWTFTANGTTSSSGIFKYEWWCDGSWVAANSPEPPPSFTTYSSIDPVVECRYLAPSVTGVSQSVALRVTDGNGITWPTGKPKVKSWELSTTPLPHNNPFAQISIMSTPQCDVATPCMQAVPISFASTGPDPTDATIVQWKWVFGDGTPAIVCGSPSCKDQVFTYQGSGTYVVTLTVTDSLGASDPDTRVVTVSGTPKVPPTAAVSASVTTGVAEQRVVFNGSGSHADGVLPGAGSPPGGITNYYWDFGEGHTETGANDTTPSFTYQNPGKYTVKLIVTATNGATNFQTILIDLGGITGHDPLLPPVNLKNSGAHKGDQLFIRNAFFDFQWTNVPRTPGDSITVQIRISSVGGFCSGLLGVGPNGRVFTVAGGAAGTTQNYRAQFNSSPFAGFNGVCATDSFTFQGQTVRVNSAGTYYSGWSDPVPLAADFF